MVYLSLFQDLEFHFLFWFLELKLIVTAFIRLWDRSGKNRHESDSFIRRSWKLKKFQFSFHPIGGNVQFMTTKICLLFPIGATLQSMTSKGFQLLIKALFSDWKGNGKFEGTKINVNTLKNNFLLLM